MPASACNDLPALTDVPGPDGDAALRGFLDAVRAVDAPPHRILSSLAARLQRPASDPVPDADDQAALPVLPTVLANPWLLGQVREVLHGRDRRTALGAWFTPPDLARTLVAAADPPRPVRSAIDPACGGGAFLLAVHEAHPAAHLAGCDLDPLSVEVTRTALRLAGSTDHDLVIRDGLAAVARTYDLVIGNPPFLSQLRTATARDDARRQSLRDRFGTSAGGYVDEVGLFVLAAATELLDEGGVAVLVVPESVLATADAAVLRAEVERRCTVEVVWRDVDGVFPGVPTCAVRLVRRPSASVPCRLAPPHPEPVDKPPTAATPVGGGTWSHLLADDVPRVMLDPDLATVGDEATATADFRDAYYLLADHVAERQREEGHPIVPVGLIDPADLRWGRVAVTFAKRRWYRPVAVGLPPAFLDRRLGPKVLVATQTRVLEVLVDATGDLLPSTPVITLRTGQPWHLAAALSSPTLTAVALQRHAGAARARGAIKLSARQVLALPLPHPGPAWDEAADAIRAAHSATGPDARRTLIEACGRAMQRAYGGAGAVDEDLLTWWTARLPRRPA